MYSDRVLEILEYNKIIDKIAYFTSSEKAKDIVMNLKPTSDYEYAKILISETAEADTVLNDLGIFPNFAYDTVDEILETAKVGSMLSVAEILKIARLLKVSRKIISTFSEISVDLPNINIRVNKLYSDKDLENEIDKSFIGDNEISDNASSELKNIRRAIKKENEKIKDKLRAFITQTQYLKILQDNIVTVRNDRYVIPVKSEYRGEISGLIHDQSASGSTVYIEPTAIVESNNELKILLVNEKREIERILRDFTSKIATVSGFLYNNSIAIAELDTIFAKAQYSREIKGVVPNINSRGFVSITNGRHPLLNKENVVPVSINIGKDFDILLITGPNTGGKTVTLKLLGLFVLLGLSGVMLPCDEAEISVFDNIYCDIGDEQSIAQNLSTFSSHMKNISEIVQNITEKTLILLDELGAGTDPIEGSALAVSITDFIREHKAKAVITTHYSELKAYSFDHEGVKNASMEFNPDTFAPTYHLNIGLAGSSNALFIAKKYGLTDKIIENAKKRMSEDKIKFENILREAEASRINTETEQKKLISMQNELNIELSEAKRQKNLLILQRQKLNDTVKSEAKRLLNEYMSYADELIESIKSILDNPTEQGLFEARKLKNKLKVITVDEEKIEKDVVTDDNVPQIGDTVFVKSLNQQGVVESINAKGEATVLFGNVKMNLKTNKLKRVVTKNEKKIVSVAKEYSNETVTTEVNLIGQTTLEAVENLDFFINKAVLNNLEEIRVVHGFGTGALRAAVQNYLKKSKHVESYRDGKYGEGDRGVTIVKLK